MKESFTINETSNTPKISWEAESMKLEIRGRLTLHTSRDFLKPIFDCIADFTKPTKIILALEYFNIYSIKSLLNFFKEVEKIKGYKENVSVEWLYEEKDYFLEEAGLDFKELVNIPFQLVPVTKSHPVISPVFPKFRNDQYRMVGMA